MQDRVKNFKTLVLLAVIAALCGLALRANAQSQKGQILGGPAIHNRQAYAGPLKPVQGNAPMDEGGAAQTVNQQQPLQLKGLDAVSQGKSVVGDAQTGMPASAIQMNWPAGAQAAMQRNMANTDGRLPTNSETQLYLANMASTLAASVNAPDKQMHAAKANLDAQGMEVANAMADLEKQMAASAIDYCSSFLANFTTDGGSKWNQLRNGIFVPMAVLLLLPGAIMTQVKSIISAGSPVLGESNPLEGIQRSAIAIFLIPGTYLVLNYSIDLNNSVTYSIAQEYTRLFGTNMYRDAISFHIRAFPARQPGENRNALDQPTAMMGPLLNDKTAFAQFEGKMIENKLEDPVAGIYNAPANRADEALPSSVIAAKTMLNSTNTTFMIAWNILCAFQMVYFYYLWFVGPITGALWAWPIASLRNAFPSWVEGVITLGFWSLFWNTTILLMACFRGVDETGTLVLTALNFLASASVKYAFDFAGLAKGAGEEAFSMAQSAMQSAQQSAGGAGSKGAGSSKAGAQSGGRQGGAAASGGGLAGGPGRASGTQHSSVNSVAGLSGHSETGTSSQALPGSFGQTNTSSASQGSLINQISAGNAMATGGRNIADVGLPPSASRLVDPSLGRADIHAPATIGSTYGASLPPGLSGHSSTNNLPGQAKSTLLTKDTDNVFAPATGSTFAGQAAINPNLNTQSSLASQTVIDNGDMSEHNYFTDNLLKSAASSLPNLQGGPPLSNAINSVSLSHNANISGSGSVPPPTSSGYLSGPPANHMRSTVDTTNGIPTLQADSTASLVEVGNSYSSPVVTVSVEMVPPISFAPTTPLTTADYVRQSGDGSVPNTQVPHTQVQQDTTNFKASDVAQRIAFDASPTSYQSVAPATINDAYSKSVLESMNAISHWADSNAVFPDNNVFSNSVSPPTTPSDSSVIQVGNDYATPVVTSSVEVVPPVSFASPAPTVTADYARQFGDSNMPITLADQDTTNVRASDVAQRIAFDASPTSYQSVAPATSTDAYSKTVADSASATPSTADTTPTRMDHTLTARHDSAFQAVEAHNIASELRAQLVPQGLNKTETTIGDVGASIVAAAATHLRPDARWVIQKKPEVPQFINKMSSILDANTAEAPSDAHTGQSLERQLIESDCRTQAVAPNALSMALGRANAASIKTKGSSEHLTNALIDFHTISSLLHQGKAHEAQLVADYALDHISKCHGDEPQLLPLVKAFVRLFQQKNMVEEAKAFADKERTIAVPITTSGAGFGRDIWDSGDAYSDR